MCLKFKPQMVFLNKVCEPNCEHINESKLIILLYQLLIIFILEWTRYNDASLNHKRHSKLCQKESRRELENFHNEKFHNVSYPSKVARNESFIIKRNSKKLLLLLYVY